MRSALLVVVLVLLAGLGLGIAAEQDDIAKNPTCPYCGMDRAKFAHSRMHVKYDDGSVLGTCSVHCLAVDLALMIDKTPIYFGVGDFNTKKLIDAEKAFWVIGGGKPGVMTARAKWAFENKADADQYLQAHGGKAATFDEVLEASYEDMNKDTKMIRERRKAKREQKK
jgi:hypothetical protein